MVDLDKPIDSVLSSNLYTNETHVRWEPFYAMATTSLYALVTSI